MAQGRHIIHNRAVGLQGKEERPAMPLRVEHRRPPSGGPSPPRRGWVLYDAGCPFCRRWARRLRPQLRRHGFELTPLKTAWVRQYFHDLTEQELLEAFRVLRRDGRHLSAGDAMVHIGRYVWWLWPVWLAGQFPPLRWIIRRAYRWVSRHRAALATFP